MEATTAATESTLGTSNDIENGCNDDDIHIHGYSAAGDSNCKKKTKIGGANPFAMLGEEDDDGDDVDGVGSSSTCSTKRKEMEEEEMKKRKGRLRKKAKSGDIKTDDLLEECLKLGVDVQVKLRARASLTSVAVKEVRDLIRSSLLSTQFPMPRFCQLANHAALTAVVVVAIQGVPSAEAHQCLSYKFRRSFDVASTMRIFEDGTKGCKTLIEALLYAPLAEQTPPKTSKGKGGSGISSSGGGGARGGGNAKSKQEDKDKKGGGGEEALDYTMTMAEMRQHEFPLPILATAQVEVEVEEIAVETAGNGNKVSAQTAAALSLSSVASTTSSTSVTTTMTVVETLETLDEMGVDRLELVHEDNGVLTTAVDEAGSMVAVDNSLPPPTSSSSSSSSLSSSGLPPPPPPPPAALDGANVDVLLPTAEEAAAIVPELYAVPGLPGFYFTMRHPTPPPLSSLLSSSNCIANHADDVNVDGGKGVDAPAATSRNTDNQTGNGCYSDNNTCSRSFDDQGSGSGTHTRNGHHHTSCNSHESNPMEEGGDQADRRVTESMSKSPPHPPRLISIDCEMVLTTAGPELARVTMVGADRTVLLDELVKPANTITDYLTKYSGITPAVLKYTDTSLMQIQIAIMRILKSTDVLVGHSLENDLRALKLCHLRCVDTSLLYPHAKSGFKSSLKFLCKLYLKRNIQDSSAGHNSEEDALAALDLTLLKIKHGPLFGMERTKRNMLESLSSAGLQCVMVADAAICKAHGTVGNTSTVIKGNSTTAIPAAVKATNMCQSKGGGLVFVQWHVPEGMLTTQQAGQLAASEDGGVAWLRDRETVLMRDDDVVVDIHSWSGNASGDGGGGGRDGDREGGGAVAAAGEGQETENQAMIRKSFANIERSIKFLQEGLPRGTLLVVTMQSDADVIKSMILQKEACEDNRSASVWTDKLECFKERLASHAKNGCLLITTV